MKHIIYIAVIVILSIFLFKAECGKPSVKGEDIKVGGKTYEVIKRTIDTQYVPYKVQGRTDTLIEDTTVYVEVPYIDSVTLRKYAEEYYTKKVFNDTININFGNVYIQDTVSRNRIISRTWWTDLELPTITETRIVKDKPKNELYVGIKSDFQKNGTFAGIGPSLLIKTKKNRIYGAGVSLVGSNIVYNIQMNIKL